MKTLLTMTVAALALASCSKKTDTAVVATPTETTMAQAPSPMANQAPTGNMAGTYEVKMADGTMVTETINADGTYSDMANGKQTMGKWRMNGEQSCFDPDGDAAEVCYTSTAPGADGSFTVMSPDGKMHSTVRKVGAAPAM